MSWQVIRQRPDQIQSDQAGNTVTGVVVYFQTGLGNESSVFIQDTLYSDAAAVRQAIDRKAAIVDEVGTMRSAPAGM